MQAHIALGIGPTGCAQRPPRCTVYSRLGARARVGVSKPVRLCVSRACRVSLREVERVYVRNGLVRAFPQRTFTSPGPWPLSSRKPRVLCNDPVL